MNGVIHSERSAAHVFCAPFVFSEGEESIRASGHENLPFATSVTLIDPKQKEALGEEQPKLAAGASGN